MPVFTHFSAQNKAPILVGDIYFFKDARNYWICTLENFKKVRTYKGFCCQEYKGAMIFFVYTRAYATFRAKVQKITYRSMVGQFLGKITR